MLHLALAALLAQAPVATTPGAPPAVATSTVSGTATLGGSVLTGNSQSTVLTLGSALARTTPDWIYGFKLSAAYGRSTDPNTGAESTSALNGSASVRGARRISQTVALYLEGIVDTDHLKSIEWRPTGEAGVSLQILDRKDGDFVTDAVRADFGFRGGYEYRFQYYSGTQPNDVRDLPDVTIAAPKVGFVFRYAFTRDTILGDEISALVNLPDGPRLLLNNVVKLSTRLQRALSFVVSYGFAEDTSPPPGKKKLDTTLTVAFEMTI